MYFLKESLNNLRIYHSNCIAFRFYCNTVTSAYSSVRAAHTPTNSPIYSFTHSSKYRNKFCISISSNFSFSSKYSRQLQLIASITLVCGTILKKQQNENNRGGSRKKLPGGQNMIYEESFSW